MIFLFLFTFLGISALTVFFLYFYKGNKSNELKEYINNILKAFKDISTSLLEIIKIIYYLLSEDTSSSESNLNETGLLDKPISNNEAVLTDKKEPKEESELVTSIKNQENIDTLNNINNINNQEIKEVTNQTVTKDLGESISKDTIDKSSEDILLSNNTDSTDSENCSIENKSIEDNKLTTETQSPSSSSEIKEETSDFN